MSDDPRTMDDAQSGPAASPADCGESAGGGFRVDDREVIHETLEGESVLVHLGTGVYFSMAGVASEIWPLVVADCNRATIVETLASRFEVARETLERDVTSLLEQLVEHQLATPGGPGQGAAPEPTADAATRRSYEPPRLDAFEDMQQLLLLDPIHETGDEGWPGQSS